jgi:hypothetical protein
LERVSATKSFDVESQKKESRYSVDPPLCRRNERV